MIRVRYKDLSSGLHGKAEDCARGVTVYLLPGLTGSQRKAALRRLRQEASRGCGPALPVSQLTVALGWDRVRTAFGSAAAVVRLHPAASLLPTAVAGALMTLFVLASVSVPIDSAPQPVSGGAAAGSGSPAPAAFTPSVRVGGPRQAPPVAVAAEPGGSGGSRQKTARSPVATSGSWADGKGLGPRTRPGFRSGISSGAGSGPGVPIGVSIGAPSSP